MSSDDRPSAEVISLSSDMGIGSTSKENNGSAGVSLTKPDQPFAGGGISKRHTLKLT
jgi:hypothetical protein